MALMDDTFIHPFSPSSELVSISSGVTIPKEFVGDVLDAKQIRVRLIKYFIKESLETDPSVNLFETIPRTNLFTFSRLIKSKKVKLVLL